MMTADPSMNAHIWRDPFEVPASLIPEGMTFQWCAKRADSTGERQDDYEKMLDAGWVPVPQQWIPGGRPMINGNDLMCRPKWMADNAKIENAKKVQKQTDDWAKRWGAEGFSGGVRTWTGDANVLPAWEKVGDANIAPLITANRITRTIDAAGDPQPRVTHIPRHPWLRWLFNLISKEVTR
jgi:hypothetical protein